MSFASALATNTIVELQEYALHPAIRVALAFCHRCSLAQLSVTNGGGSPACDARIKWDKPLRHRRREEVQISDPSGLLPVLLPRDEAT